MDNKIKYGIIGTGAIARKHAEALQLIDNAELFMVYDTVTARAKAFAEAFNCRYAETLNQLLASEIEAVTIATPSGLHGECAIPAAKAGKHILCEKPLEVTISKVNDLIRTCESSNVRLSAVFQSRFSTAVRQIRQAIEAGRFGQPVLASASVRWFRNHEYYANAVWRGTWALDGGGALMNQGIHTVDLLLYFNGDVREVTGRFTKIMHKNIEVEDTAVAILRFNNGSLGTIEASTACAPGLPRRVELSGTEGSVTLEGDRITRWEFLKETPEDAKIRERLSHGENMQGGESDPMSISVEGHRRQLQELTDAIRGGHCLTAPGSEGKRAVELICSIYESARTGTSINFF